MSDVPDVPGDDQLPDVPGDDQLPVALHGAEVDLEVGRDVEGAVHGAVREQAERRGHRAVGRRPEGAE